MINEIVEVKFPDNIQVRVSAITCEEALSLINAYHFKNPIQKLNIHDSPAFYLFFLQTRKCLMEHFNNDESLAKTYVHSLPLVTSMAWRKASRKYTQEYDRLCKNLDLRAKLDRL
ncbi:1643_t:CDS:1 [Acaulospora morrowiae]|uniref:1643_t:CDS:1 n=1 Tax=Acaulospora morrowiae TaxID=94023 RepID=A0A9N9DP86_9GLOM|nr:1643_t:CDS:1 [Acaulospora morrowiae]